MSDFAELDNADKVNRSIKRVSIAWLTLMVLTIASVLTKKLAINTHWLVPLVVLLVVIKGQQIVDIFMEMDTAPTPWRLLCLSYVVLVPLLIGLILQFSEH